MNDFDFVLRDIMLNKDVKLTEDEYFDIRLALTSASLMFKNSGTLEHKRKSRQFLRLEDKLSR